MFVSNGGNTRHQLTPRHVVSEIPDSRTQRVKYGIPQIDNFKNSPPVNKALQEAELSFKANIITTSPLDYSLVAQLNNKVQEFQDQNPDDLETSPTLAAETGTALLIENNRLKQELQDMKKAKGENYQLLEKYTRLEAELADTVEKLEKWNRMKKNILLQ